MMRHKDHAGESSGEIKKAGVYFGIDLGTSNCSVAYVVASQRRTIGIQAKVVEFPFGGDKGQKSTRFPSVIAKKGTEKTGKKSLYGFDAEARNRFELGKELFRSIKSHLGTLRSYIHAFIADFKSPVNAWGMLIERLSDLTAEGTANKLDPRKYPTILTVPASFDFQRRQETLDAAEKAGFRRENIRLIDEPIAALIDWISGPEADHCLLKQNEWSNILVFDFGGGTCDLSLVAARYAEGAPLDLEIKNLAISPYGLLGGDTIDLAVMAYLWPQIEALTGIRRARLSAIDRKLVENANRLTCRTLKEKLCVALGKLEPEDRKRCLWGPVVAKELLAKGVALSTGETIAGRVELSAQAFHEIMQPFLDPNGGRFLVNESVSADSLVRLVENILDIAGMESRDLDIILLHGGSCKNPLIRDALEELVGQSSLFGDCRITQTPDLDASVARGAALHGYHLHHEHHWLVRPIVSENMGIVTRGDVCEVLVEAGTMLPFPEDGWHAIRGRFVTSRLNQRKILVPLFVGTVPDGNWPRIAASLTMGMPHDLPDGHPIEVNLRINEDKLTELQFKPAGDHPWTNVWKIDDPWIRQFSSADAQEELLAVRGQIREHIDNGRDIPVWLQTQEALKAARAGDSPEAMILIENILVDHATDANAWNTKGLVHWQRDEMEISCDCFAEAARLDATAPIYRGNYGTALCDVGKYDQAILEMRAALAMNSSLRYLHSWLATAFERLNQLDEVKKELNRWLDSARRRSGAEPDEVAAWRDLENVCRRLGHYDEADDAKRKALQLSRTRQAGGSPDDLLTSANW